MRVSVVLRVAIVLVVLVRVISLLCQFLFLLFFFKQKTAYEMRISDWSSDVCSSDLHSPPSLWLRSTRLEWPARQQAQVLLRQARPRQRRIGRASCRERVCQYV